MFLRSSKQAYAKLSQTRQTLMRMQAASACASNAFFAPATHCSFLSKNRAPAHQLFGAIPRRSFSYPEHIVMEMPNLSPTMEKVRTTKKTGQLNIKANPFLARRETSSSGTKRSATRAPQVTSSPPSRPTRLLSTSNSRKRATSPPSSTPMVPKTSLLAPPSPSSWRTKRTLLLLPTTILPVPLLPRPLPPQPPPKLRPLLRRLPPPPATPITSPLRCRTCRPRWKR
jgi:hypothetical protein